METDKDADGNVYSAGGDKEDLIPDGTGSGKPDVPKSESVNSDGSHRNETSPLHKAKKVLKSGKDVTSSRGLQLVIAGAVIFAVIITIALILSIYLGPPQVGANGGVAADVPECSTMGLGILEQGGNAVDAAITTMLCVGVVNVQSSGIGGGGFMLVHDHKNQKSKVFDFRETAPGGSTKKMFTSRDEALVGGLAVAVPGEVKGMEEAHKQYGKLAWKNVVKPAADLARNGFKITKSMENVFLKGKVKLSDFTGNLRKYYIKDDKFVEAGTTIKRPDLAKTLDIIADEGAKAFYDGKLTDSIINAIQSANPKGILTRKDLKDYKVVVRDIVKTTYNGHTVISVPVPASGPVVLSILNILEGYKFTKGSENKTSTYHKILEAFKFAFAQQQQLGDPADTAYKPIYTEKMLNKTVAKLIREMTDNVTHTDKSFYDLKNYSPLDGGTSHISIIDSQEMMVSVTTTINYWFGSRVITDTGILLNDQMADFSIPTVDANPNEANFIYPGKRPMSNMAPTILYNAEHPCSLRMTIGGANGSRIVTGIVETLLNVASFGKTLTQAIKAPRIHNQLYPSDATEYEDGFNQTIIDALSQLGHNMVLVSEPINEVQGVMKTKDVLEAFSDPRKGGKAATFG